MASMFFCDVCDKRDKTSIAKSFCSDCEDKLCSECLSVHSALKSCANHHVVDVTVTSNTSLAVSKYCEKHADLTLEVYCCDHDVICCRSCMTDDHRSCGKLKPVEVASKDIKSSIMFEEISKQANHLKEASHLMTDTVKKSKELLNESKEASIEKVSMLKEELNRRIDELASKSVLEINKLVSELSEKIDIDEENVEKRVQIIQDTLTKFEFVAKHGSDKQLFLLLNSIKTDIYKIDADLEELLPTLKTATVEFEESDAIAILISIGSTKTRQGTCYANYEPFKQQEAQLNTRSCVAPTSFQFEKKVTFTYEKNVWISDMCVTKDSRIILCNWLEGVNELLVLTNQGQFIQIVKLKDRPWNITIEPDTTDAYVTLPLTSYLQVIDASTLSIKHQLNVSEWCYGIAFVGSDIAVGMAGKVEIISKQGVRLKSLIVGSTTIHSLCFTGDNQVYCCESIKDRFHCISLDGIRVFSYTSVDFKGPICVIADHQRNMYVLCFRSNNLHKLSPEGKNLSVMIRQDDDLRVPKAVSFNLNCSKLFLANQSTKELLIYTCK